MDVRLLQCTALLPMQARSCVAFPRRLPGIRKCRLQRSTIPPVSLSRTLFIRLRVHVCVCVGQVAGGEGCSQAKGRGVCRYLLTYQPPSVASSAYPCVCMCVFVGVRWQEERAAAKQKAEAAAEKKRKKAAGVKSKAGGSKRKASGAAAAAAAAGQTRMEQFSRPVKQARVQEGSVGLQQQQGGEQQQQQQGEQQRVHSIGALQGQQQQQPQQAGSGDMPPPAPVNLQLQSSQPPGGQQAQQQNGEQQQQQQGVDGQPAAGEVGWGAWGMGITMVLGPQQTALLAAYACVHCAC